MAEPFDGVPVIQTMFTPPAQTRPIPDLDVVQAQPRFHLRPNETAIDRIN